MLMYGLKSLLKVMVLLTFLFVTVESKSQVTINSKFKGIGYDEMIKSAQMATDAYNEAEEVVEEAYLKAISEMEVSNYRMALFYLEKCSKINKRFDYSICNQKDLDDYISYAKRQVEIQKGVNSIVKLKNVYAIPLRKYNNFNSVEVGKIPPYATIRILERRDEDIMMKVSYEGVDGFISKKWLNIR